jgi:hypothetical protein
MLTLFKCFTLRMKTDLIPVTCSVGHETVTKIQDLSSPEYLINVRFEVFTAVTMKNAVFCDIKTQFIPHRRHITSLVQSKAS